MKQKSLKRLAAVLAVLLLTAAPAAAYYPNDGLLIPVEDPYAWEVEADNGEYYDLGDPDAYVDVTINDDGTLSAKVTENCPENMRWPRVRTFFVSEPPIIDLAKTPYIYYDFTVEGTLAQWAIQVTFDGAGESSLSLARQIYIDTGRGELTPAENQDGYAGEFKGRFDLNQYLTDHPHPTAKPNGKVELTNISIYFIERLPGSDNDTKADFHFRALYFGDETQTEPPTPAPTETPTETPPTEAVTTETPTEAATDAATTEVPTETQTEAPTEAVTETSTSAPGDGNGGTDTTMIILAVAGACVLTGGIAAALILTKKKGKK